MIPDDELIAALARVLSDGGLDLLAIAPSASYDAAGPPAELTAGALLPGARTILLTGSGGPTLWQHFGAWAAASPTVRLVEEPNPLDRYVAGVLDRGSAILDGAGIRARRLEPTFLFQPRVDFRRLADVAGLGGPSPLGMIVHPTYGPWWALRGAWLIDRELPSTAPLARPCEGCPAPCRAAIPVGAEGTIAAATRSARLACVLGAHRYDDEQLDYHYLPVEGRARLLARLVSA